MLNWLKKKNNPESNNAEPNFVNQEAVIRLVGDRGSGKTAYIASLAYWPNADPSSPVQTVTPVGDEARELTSKAQDILEQGLMLEPTPLSSSPDDVKDYTLSIALKDQFSWNNPTATLENQLLQLNISCKDYAGEFFADLVSKVNDPKLDDYLEDCLQATGILLLLDGTAHRKDSEYANGIDQFLTQLDQTDLDGVQRRIAVVINKCDQSELWINRYHPQEVSRQRFPSVCGKLESWSQMGGGRVECFTTSAFGMLGCRYPEPNAKRLRRDRGGTSSIIKKPRQWRPFGLVAPIYWLCTGARHQELDQG
jgi:GTPase SAR1 family protein